METETIHEAQMVATPARVAVPLPVTMEPLLRQAAIGVADAIRAGCPSGWTVMIGPPAGETAWMLLAANSVSGRSPMAGYDEVCELWRRLLARHRLRSAEFDDATTVFCTALATNMQVAIGMGLA